MDFCMFGIDLRLLYVFQIDFCVFWIDLRLLYIFQMDFCVHVSDLRLLYMLKMEGYRFWACTYCVFEALEQNHIGFFIAKAGRTQISAYYTSFSEFQAKKHWFFSKN